jgi:microcystin degradation protein MlrC
VIFMRIIIAEFLQETNTFSPVTCGMEMFEKNTLVTGENIYKNIEGRLIELTGFLDALNKYSVDIIPSISANSISGGRVESDVFDYVFSKVIEDFKANTPIDGIVLAMHGAMVSTEYEDATGEFLRKLRQKVGERVIIGCTLDFHANITVKMIESADIIVGYHSYPHMDLYDVGYKAADLVVKTINKEIRPVMVFSKAPMILPAEACMTELNPAKKIMIKVYEMESRKEILSVSAFIMQPWLNVNDVGCSFIVIADNNEEIAEKFAKEAVRLMWSLKKDFKVDLLPLKKAFQKAYKNKMGKPVIFADSADSPSAGSPGDGNAILREILESKISLKVLLNVVDYETALIAEKIGVGNEGDFKIGAKIYRRNAKPVELKGTVVFTGDWEYRFKGPMYTGKICVMGKTAVIKALSSYIVVMENPVDNCDPELYRSLGFKLEEFDIVVVKSANGFRSPYEGLFEEAIIVDLPGASSANIKSLPFDRIKQPVFPFSYLKKFKPVINARRSRKQKE